MRRGWRSTTLLLVAVCATAVEPSPGEPKATCPIDPVYELYSVRGRTREEIREAMIQRGPKDQSGAARFAYASWNIRWRWRLDSAGDVDPTTVVVACSGTITLPKLEIQEDTPPDLVRDWGDFTERLKRHELQHLRHASERAPLIIEKLANAHRRVGRLSTIKANRIAQAVVNDIRALDRAYDKHTGYGKTEGAWSIAATSQ